VNVRGTLSRAESIAALTRWRIDPHDWVDREHQRLPGFSVYNASKAAIRSFARTWTVDLKARKIRVNVLSPGTIDTAVFVGVPTEVKQQFVAQIPLGRIGQPEDIAKAALFLASDDSSFVTGSNYSWTEVRRRSELVSLLRRYKTLGLSMLKCKRCAGGAR